MAVYTKTNTFSPSTVIASSQVNANFDEISTAINTTLLAGMTQYGVLVGAGTSSAPAAVAPNASTVKVLTSGGAIANPSYQFVAAGSFDTKTANTVLAGPTSGSAATPTFRSLVPSDVTAKVVRAVNTAGTAITGTYANIPFATETFDTMSAFATPTFTAPVAGYYRVHCRLNLATSGTNSFLLLSITKNGSLYSEFFCGTYNSTDGGGSPITDILSLAANDTVTIQAKQNSGADKNLATDTGKNVLLIEQIGV